MNLTEILVDLPSLLFVTIAVLAAFLAGRFTTYGIKITNQIVVQAGLTGTLIGLVVLLQNMSDPEQLGPALAVGLLTILYALTLSGVFTLAARKMIIQQPEFKRSLNVVALLLWTLILIVPMTTGAGISPFIDLSSLIFIGVSIAVIAGISLTRSPSNLAASLAKNLPYAGLLGLLIGAIIILSGLNDPRRLGPAVAICLLTLFYANVISVGLKLAFPKINQTEETTYWEYLGFCLIFILLIFSVLLASFM